MENWESYLHWSFREEHVLLPFIRLRDIPTFLAASLLAMIICISERCISKVVDMNWEPEAVRLSRWKKAVWRTLLYWITTFLRLCYMLITMTFHLGLILVIVTTLTISHFFLFEMQSLPKVINVEENLPEVEEPLIKERPASRPRSKSKPDAIFIHPSTSNIARADAAAFELGISGSTERVEGNKYTGENAPWRAGEGQTVARALLASKRGKSKGTITPRRAGDSSSDSESWPNHP